MRFKFDLNVIVFIPFFLFRLKDDGDQQLQLQIKLIIKKIRKKKKKKY